MAKRKTEETSDAPGKKKQEDVKAPPPLNQAETRPEGQDLSSDPDEDPAVHSPRRSPRLQKAQVNDITTRCRGEVVRFEFEDLTDEQKERHLQIQKLLAVPDKKVLFKMPGPDDDPTRWYEITQGKTMRKPAIWYESWGELKKLKHQELGKMMREMFYSIRFWAERHVVDDLNILEQRLSCEQRDQFIESLDGYCEQISWSALKELLHPEVHQSMPQVVARTFLGKKMYEMILDPFFWMCEEDGPLDMPGHEDLFFPSRAEMRNLFEWFKRVSLYDAHLWRQITCRRLIAETYELSRSPGLGENLARRRDARIEKYIAELLSPSSPLYPFLKRYDRHVDKVYLYWGLKIMLREAMTLSICMALSSSYYTVKPFSALQFYHKDHKDMKLDFIHRFTEVPWYMNNKLPEPERRGILFMLSPAITQVPCDTIGCVDEDYEENLVQCAWVVGSKEEPLGMVSCLLPS